MDPQTPEQWQDAVDGAHACLLIDAAKKYGLVTGGPVVRVDRAVEILAHGKKLGYTPRRDAAERFVAEWQAMCAQRQQRST